MKKVLRWILGILSAAVLAGLGTAVWENVMQPASLLLWRGAVNLSNLGLVSFRNNMYKEIARGFHEQLSLDVLVLVIASIVGLLFATVLTRILLFNDSGLEHTRVSRSSELIPRKKYVYILVFVFYLVFFSFFLAREKYINSAIANNNQILSMVAPYLSEQEEENYKSQFARIINREGYIALLNTLTGVLNKNHIEPPKFDVF